MNSAGVVPRKQFFFLAVLPALGTWILVFLSFPVPRLNATIAPYVDLTGAVARVWYWISLSGGRYGISIILLVFLALLVSRSDILPGRRRLEVAVIILVIAIFGVGGATLNEFVVKTAMQIPRPNIVLLAGEDGDGPLGMTADEFYASGNISDRRVPLADVLENDSLPISLSSFVKAHWIESTGYAFPSGHSYSAMFLATFFLALGVSYTKSKRRRAFFLLLPWALAVCFSRSVLRVHTPMDITVGSLVGMLAGFGAWALVCKFFRFIESRE